MDLNCQLCNRGFTLADKEIALYKKFDAKPLSVCFDCQHKRRLQFRNERILYNRKCDATGEKIVSNISPDSPYKVFSHDYWYSDQWDPMDHGREFDFNKPFFEQYRDLNINVPRLPLVNLRAENSDYCNMCVDNKNCYLVFGGDYNEDNMYTTMAMKNRDCLDIDYTNDSELCYMLDNSINCYGCRFTWDSKNCRDCAFITDCSGCEECIFCSNLKNKSFCIGNKQLTKDEYVERKKLILDGGYEKQQENWRQFLELRNNRIVKYGHIISCENVSGDYLKNSKNCINCLDVTDSEDVCDAILTDGAKDCFNVDFLGHKSELCFNSVAIITSTNIFGCYFVDNSADLFYSEQCVGCNDLFGCNGLRHKKYCILNRQYSRDDYLELKEKIISHMKKTGEWGRFFPIDFTPFAYNEGTCMRYYPLTKERAELEGFSLKQPDPKDYKPQKYIIPDNIKEVDNGITEEILACEDCGKNYKILGAELEFYKKNNIAVPHKCHDCRQLMRRSLRTPFKLYDRSCAKCGAAIQTTYSPDRPETVCCENCYLKEVY